MFSHRFYKTFLCDTLTSGNLSNNNFTLLLLLMWSCSKDSTWYWSVTVYAKSKGGQSNTRKLYLPNMMLKIWWNLGHITFFTLGPSWPWSYGSWIYNYICNQCLSPLMRVRISIKTRCTTLCDKVYQWLAIGRWFSQGSPVSSIIKNDCHDNWNIVESGAKHHKSNQTKKTHINLRINEIKAVNWIVTKPYPISSPISCPCSIF